MMMRISAMGREVELIDVIFAVFLVASLIWQNGYLSQLKQIPSPLYGGDYYNGLGGGEPHTKRREHPGKRADGGRAALGAVDVPSFGFCILGD